MTSKILTLALAGTLSLTTATAQQLNLIPTPKSYTLANGQFVLSASTSLYAPSSEAVSVAELIVPKMRTATGYALPIDRKKAAKGSIKLILSSDAKMPKEGYTLTVNKDGVRIEAATRSGLYYGMQSLLQLLPTDIENLPAKGETNWAIPYVSIEDSPRFPYRGVMIDPCRHFMPLDVLKKQIDVLSLYKINKLHLHLTEDQGWRIEIKKYPKLTEVGAWRTEQDGFRHGGYYTQEQLRELVRYAAEREITIIPEFEIPGHELAAIAAYPWLSCTGDSVKQPRITWGVEDILMCPAKPTTMQFIQDVIDEFVQIFPGEYFHIGGDEAPKKAWKECPNCQALIAKLGLTDDEHHSKEDKLQNYVVAEVEKMLNKHGKRIIGWDEILEGGNLTKTATVMSWRGERGGIAAAKAGQDVIMTPGSGGMYVDFYQGDSKVEPTTIGNYAPLAKTYAYNPTPQSLVDEGKEHYVQGVQANMWTEYVLNPELLDYQIYPRALAVAETGWSPNEKKDFTDFARRVDYDAARRLTAHGVNFHIPLPEQPGGSCSNLVCTDDTPARVELTSTRPVRIVYTTDGTYPTEYSPTYTAPLSFSQNTTLRTASILPSGNMSAVRNIEIRHSDYLAPATTEEKLDSGLAVRIARGTYFLSAETMSIANWSDTTISTLRQLPKFTPQPAALTEVNNYAAVAEGYIKIPANGIYTFSSNNSMVFIGGKLLINNDETLAKRHSRNDAQIALQAGLHSIKVIFLSNISGGWPSYWDSGSINYRKLGSDKWQEVTPQMLSHAAPKQVLNDKGTSNKKKSAK